MTPQANVLLVDDEPANLLALEAVLRPLGQNLVRASSGDEALKLLLKYDFAAILLDVHMPDLDGFETAALIKQRTRTRHVPIIFITAMSKDTEHVFRGYSEGAVDYLLKPYDPAVLRSKVSVFVQLYQKTAALEESEQRFRTAFANAPSGMALVDEGGSLIQINNALSSVLGRSEGELVGASWDEVFPPAASDEETNGRRRLMRPDGQELEVVLTTAPMSTDGPGAGQVIVQLEDVTERARAEEERAELLREQAARSEAEAMSRMVRSLQTVSDAALEHLTLNDLVPELLGRVREIMSADSVSLLLCDADREILELRATSGVETAPDGLRIPVGRGTFPGRIAKEQRTIVLDDIRSADEGGAFELALQEAGLRSLMGVPLVGDGGVTGVLHVASSSAGRFTADDRALLSLIADRAALAIANARLYDREHRVVETLQRSLLPARLPQPPGASIAARYEPGGGDVGGDWYDAVWLEDGSLALAMGDVAGHGLDAAALMGELRNALRAYVVESAAPESVVNRLGNLLRCTGVERMTTLLYALVDPNAESVRYVSAGHLPPLVLDPEGQAEYLWAARGFPLGAVDYAAAEEAEADFPSGSTLVLYTDGLVEVPGETLDQGLARLTGAVENAEHEPEALCDHVMKELADPDGRDDTALLALTTIPLTDDRISLRIPATPGSLAQGRRMLARWLEGRGAEPEEIRDIELACHEACTNAAEHGHSFAEAHFDLEAVHREGEVALTVRDTGSWREPMNGNRGKGLVLMRQLMDDVSVETTPDGTVVELRRLLT